MASNEKRRPFIMFAESVPGKPQNWTCTIVTIIAVCLMNVLILAALRTMLEVRNAAGDPILSDKQRDIVIELLAIMSMTFGFGCCCCFCCACKLPYYTVRGVGKLGKFICRQCTEDAGQKEDLISSIYDGRNYHSNFTSIDEESGSVHSPTALGSPSLQNLDPVAAARARYESRKVFKNIFRRPSAVVVKPPPKPIIKKVRIMEPMETVQEIEQQLFAPGFVPPLPKPTAPKRRMTLAAATLGIENRAFQF